MNQSELDLMDFLNSLWKRKWLIIIPAFFCVIITGVYSFLLPQVWEVDAVIVPSKFFIQTAAGEFDEIVVIDPIQLAGQINEETYNNLIAAELNLDVREFPTLSAENLRDTNLVRVSLKEQDVEKAKLILLSLFNHLKRELDKKIDVETKDVDTQIANNENAIEKKNLNIQSKEIEKSKLVEEISSTQNKLKISEERFKNIMDEMKEVKKRIDEIEKQQRNALTEKKEGSEAIALLLYSNEIQQNLRYYNTLDEKLNNEKIIQENLKLLKIGLGKDIKQLDTQIEILRSDIEDIKNRIDFLIEKKGRLDYAQLIKEPTSSIAPVSPKKKRNVLIAGILSLVIFTTLALFIENLERYKSLKVKIK